MRPNLKDHSLESLRARFAADGIEPWRAEQVAGWLYARSATDTSVHCPGSSTPRA